MKKCLGIVLSVFVTMVGVTTAHADKSLAMNKYGDWGWAEGYRGQERARSVAIDKCESYGTYCFMSVAEGENWFFTGITCDYESYVGASPQGFRRSRQIAFWKALQAGDSGCSVVVNKY